MIRHALFIIACAIPSAPPCYAQDNPMQNIGLLERIDKDMSPFPFDMKEEEARKLRAEDVTYSEDDVNFGILTDSAGVRHDFYEGLYGKTLEIAPSSNARYIKALGIGLARSQKDVLAAFSDYSGGKQMECDYRYDLSSETKPRLSDDIYCDFVFDDNFDAIISLKFDGKDRLVHIYVQAWNPF